MVNGANIAKEDRDMHWAIKLTVIFGLLNLGWKCFSCVSKRSGPQEHRLRSLMPQFTARAGDILIGAAVALLVRTIVRREGTAGCSWHAS